MFPYNYATPGPSYVAALPNSTQQQTRQIAERMRAAPALQQPFHKEAGQSILAGNLSSTSQNDMFKVAPVVQQMAGFSEAVQAEDKIVTITKNCSKTHDSGW
jgi:hypothetical protein